MANRIQLRRDTSANWATINPILADGEPGLEIDTNKIKYGDGTHGWVSLSYSGSSDPTRLVNGSSQAVLAPDGALLLSNLIEWPGADGGLQAGSSAWILHQDGSTRFPHYTFPASDGSANQVLQTNGSGVLSWETISTVTDQLVNGSYTVALNSSGVLTVPGAIQSTNGIVISNAGVVGATAGIVLPANAGTGAVQIGNTYGPIQLGSAAGGGTELNWTFDTTGILTVPITASGAGQISGGTNGLQLVSNSNTWGFGTDASLTVPGIITLPNGQGQIGSNGNAGLDITNTTLTYGYVTLNYNNQSYVTANSSGVQITTINSPSMTWSFSSSSNGTLTLPLGGTITEGTSPTGVGNFMALTPGSGNDSHQQLVIYPTVVEGNHLHLTSGDLTVTSLFLGNDTQYIRTRTDGAMVIGTGDTYPETPGYGHRWVFGANGVVSLPANTFHTNNNLTVQTSGIPASVTGVNYSSGSWDANQGTNISTTGGTGSGLTVDVTADVSGYVGSVTIHTPGNGYSDGDVISASNGSSSVQFSIHILSAKSWTFGADGTLTFPDSTVQTSAYYPIRSGFNASAPIVQIDNAQFSFNNTGNPTVAAVSGTWEGPWTADAKIWDGTSSYVTTSYGNTTATWTSIAAYGIGVTFGNPGDQVIAHFTDNSTGHLYRVSWFASASSVTTNCTIIVEKLI